jgi:MFS family permease
MAAVSDGIAAPGEGAGAGFGTRLYRTYVLNALLLVYILNFVDRGLLAVVAPQLKPALGISDTQFGLLTGFGFALVYTTLGVPIAQLAERRHRVWIMTVCIAVWSLMTALCGLSREVTIGSITIGAFWVLLACRVGVGMGEAGCSPPASSLIADYFPPQHRSTAAGYYAMGVTLGTVLANLIGGPVTDAFGWRSAFLIVGVPGLLVALLLKLTVTEPPRGYTDPPGAERLKERPRFVEGLRELASKPSFWTVAAGAALAMFCSYGITTFRSLFIARSFGLTAGQAAVMINVPVGIAQALGALAIGWLAQQLAPRSRNAVAWLTGGGLLMTTVWEVIAFTTQNLWLCLAALCIGGATQYGYLTTLYTVAQGASARVRAVSTAVLLLIGNLFGYGLGPLFIGALSDTLFSRKVAALGAAGLSRHACESGGHFRLLEAQQQICAVANPESLQQAMLATACLYALSGACFLLSCRWLHKDMTAG